MLNLDDRNRLANILSDWHGGQWSATYKLQCQLRCGESCAMIGAELFEDAARELASCQSGAIETWEKDAAWAVKKMRRAARILRANSKTANAAEV